MPKIALDELEEYLDEEDQESPIDYKRKIRNEKKELKKKKIKFYSRERTEE